MQLDQERAVNEERDEEDEEPQRCLNIKTLREAFSFIEQGLELLTDHDPNPARSATAVHGVQQSLKIYREILEAKKRQAKQTTISSFFTARRSTTADTSTAGPSTADTTAGIFKSFFKATATPPCLSPAAGRSTTPARSTSPARSTTSTCSTTAAHSTSQEEPDDPVPISDDEDE